MVQEVRQGPGRQVTLVLPPLRGFLSVLQSRACQAILEVQQGRSFLVGLPVRTLPWLLSLLGVPRVRRVQRVLSFQEDQRDRTLRWGPGNQLDRPLRRLPCLQEVRLILQDRALQEDQGVRGNHLDLDFLWDRHLRGVL